MNGQPNGTPTLWRDAWRGNHNGSQGPGFDRPRLDRFHRMMDNSGVQYAQDDFTYSLKFGDMAAGAAVPLQIEIERDSAFDAVDILAAARVNGGAFSPDATIEFFVSDGASNRNLSNRAIPMQNFAGNGQQPFVMPISRRFMPSTTITVVAHNYGAATVDDVRFALRGRKLFVAGLRGRPLSRFNKWTAPTGLVYSEDFFMYDFFLASLAASASATVGVPVTVLTEADSDFEWILATCTSATGEAVNRSIGGNNFDLIVRDGGSSRDLQDVPDDASLLAGIGTFPFVLPQPRLFISKTPITVTFYPNPEFDTEIDDIHFTMIGRKLFEQD